MLKKRLLILFLAAGFITVFSTPAAAKPVTIAITPFSVTSESGLDWLGTGVIDLFSSRLSGGGGIDIIEKARTSALTGVTRKTAVGTARRLGADYILFGTIVESAKGVVLEGQVASVKSGEITVFTEKSGQYESADVLLLLLSRVATAIRQDIFGVEASIETKEKPVHQERNIYAHPDTLIDGLNMEKK